MTTAIKSQRFDAYHVIPDSPQMQQDFLYSVVSLAARSSDPMLEDVVRVGKVNACLPLYVQGFQETANKGLGGLIQLPKEHYPRAVVLGTWSFIRECGLEIPELLEATIQKWGAESDTTLLLAGWDGWVRGILKFKN